MRRSGIGSHTRPNTGRTNDWITPKHILDALGTFDLDPCQSLRQPWLCAKRGYTVTDDGLSKRWRGRCFVNPPYGAESLPFMQRLAEHRNGIGLLFGRTETSMFRRHIWQEADAILFVDGRLHFHYPTELGRKPCLNDEHPWTGRPENKKKLWCPKCGKAHGNSGGPSVLIAYGKENVEALRNSGLAGALVETWKVLRTKRR